MKLLKLPLSVAFFFSLFFSPRFALADQQTFTPGQLNVGINQPISLAGLNLVLQNDGNFVAYASTGPVWASNTSVNCGGNCLAVFQIDGNLVLYHAGAPYWSTGTYAYPSDQLVVSTKAPYVQIVNAGTILWPIATSTAVPPPPSTQQIFGAGQFSLTVNDSVQLTQLNLVLQTDGNFVAYDSGKPVWSSNTVQSCATDCLASFQSDGNLVLYHAGTPYWSTQTYNHPNAQFVTSNAVPYIQITDAGKIIWPVTTAAVPTPPPPASSCPTLSCYYIDSVAGSDANSGNSPATAWKTLSNVATAAIAPGTSILLARGSKFSGQLTLTTSGTAANPVVVAAYGTGALPVLSGGTYGVLGQSISYINISSLAIANVADTGILGTGNGTEYWTVSNCTITNVGTSGIQARPDWTDASPLRGWVIQGNTIGTVNTAATLNYDKAGILVRGTAGALVTKNTVTAVNTSGIRIQSYQSAQSQNTTVSYNEVKMNQGGIAVRDTLNAVVTHNWIHDGQGYAIGISGSQNSQGVYTSYNNVLTYNLAQNMTKSADGQLYNGFDITSSSNGKIYHNTIENVYAHSVSLEGDAGPANNWVVRNNIFDARRQGSGQDGNCFLFRLVDYNSEVLSNNLFMSNVNWVGIIGTDMDAGTDLAIWYTPAWIALGIDHSSLYNQDPAFDDVLGEKLDLEAGSYARNLGVSLAAINQVSLDAGALPYGQTSVLTF